MYKENKKVLGRLFFVTILLFFVVGCGVQHDDVNNEEDSISVSFEKSQPTQDEISKTQEYPFEGEWFFSQEHKEYYPGPDGKEISSGISSFKRWEFGNGKFQMTGYPIIESSGTYEVVSEMGTKFDLKLNDPNIYIPPDPGVPKNIIRIEKAETPGTWYIGGEGPFVLVEE